MSNQIQKEKIAFPVRVKMFFRLAGYWIFRLRKLLLSIPVVAGAVYVARLSHNELPEVVGLMLRNDGAFSYYVGRATVIQTSLLITAGCLLMMLLSKKTLYPWLISLFSLALPVVILLLNVFLA